MHCIVRSGNARSRAYHQGRRNPTGRLVGKKQSTVNDVDVDSQARVEPALVVNMPWDEDGTARCAVWYVMCVFACRLSMNTEYFAAQHLAIS
jgi:hypothetical protein